eukprot:m.262507 g.262507  ORF g.262507 m.262507 type:complete len:447 (+) comp19231_c1_seq3:2076-3416(+)
MAGDNDNAGAAAAGQRASKKKKDKSKKHKKHSKHKHKRALNNVGDDADAANTSPKQAHKRKRTASSREEVDDVHQRMAQEDEDFERRALLDVWDHKKLTEDGVTFKSGKWSQKEREILKKNVENFKLDYGVDDVAAFALRSHRDESSDDMPVVSKKEFYKALAKGLDRPLFFVYRQCLRILDPDNYLGKYDDEETEELFQLHAKYGDNWTKIGKLLGRSSMSVRDRFRIASQTCHHGEWQQEEVDKLVQIVEGLIGSDPPPTLVRFLPWTAISALHGTRSPFQCREKWYLVSWKHTKDPSKWDPEDDDNLAAKVLDSGAEDMSEVDWHDIAAQLKGKRSATYLQVRMKHLLKRAASVNPDATTFEELLEEVLRFWRRRKIKSKATVTADDDDEHPGGDNDEDLGGDDANANNPDKGETSEPHQKAKKKSKKKHSHKKKRKRATSDE